GRLIFVFARYQGRLDRYHQSRRGGGDRPGGRDEHADRRDVGDDVPDLRRGDALAARHHPDLAQAAGTDLTRPSMYTLDPRSRALMSNSDPDPRPLPPDPRA